LDVRRASRSLKNLLALSALLALASGVSKGQSTKAVLRQPKQRYRELFEQTPQPLWVFDYERLRFFAVNQAAVTAYGYTKDEFLAMPVADLLLPEEQAAWREALTGAREGGEIEPLWRHRKKNGTIIEVEITYRNVTFDGRPACLVLCADITERRRTELQTTAYAELGRRLSAARTPGEAAQIIMGAAEALFGWDACIFQLCCEDNENLRTILCIDTIEGKKVDVTSEDPVGPPGAHARDALKHGARLILRQQPDGFPPDMHPFGDKSRPSASLMFAPVRKDREPLGVLSIQSYLPNRYNEHDLRSFQALADHCASALERIRAEAELKRLYSELERRVHERTAQLEVLNKELEAFSYSVSHDLRAPLRSILGFSEVLLERYAGSLDPRGRELLRRACDSSQQMDRLIESLLKLSRVGRAELQRQKVDLTRLAETILESLRQSEPERQVRTILAPGLHAWGDERLLRVALDNLLRNAWKFTSKQPKALIELGLDTGKCAFFVRDNGAGFDMAYAAKLFGVFQRLHSTTEFPGTGVGLATVQRIVNRHGGKVWAESAVEKGATFYFSLPHHES